MNPLTDQIQKFLESLGVKKTLPPQTLLLAAGGLFLFIGLIMPCMLFSAISGRRNRVVEQPTAPTPVVAAAEPTKPEPSQAPAETTPPAPAQPPAPPAPTVPTRFPAPCSAGSMLPGFALVSGTSDLCVPINEAAIVASLANLPAAPSTYSDDVPASLLLAPRPALEETSALSSSERASLASAFKQTRFKSWNLGSGCSRSWTGAVGRVTMECEFDDYYVNGSPSVKREQSCETMEGDSCGECETHGDCEGWTCGCPGSRCFFGMCTRCPSERVCDDPTFESTVPKWTVQSTFGTGPGSDVVRQAVEGGGWSLLVGTRVTRAFRDVRTRRPTADEIEAEEYERGDSVVDNDTGYFLGLEPYYVGLVHCSGECNPAGNVEVIHLLTGRGTSYTLSAADGRSVTVTCSGGVCGGRTR